MKKSKTSRKPQIPKKSKKDCPFCKSKVVPDYKEYNELSKFISDRGKITPRRKSGVCARHQRALTQSIKRARHLALLWSMRRGR